MGATRKLLNWYARLSPARGKRSPPYEHVVQIGDPTLRKVSEPVSVDKIRTDEVQSIIMRLRYVLDKYGCVGLSAPQIGVNKRIFVMRQTGIQIASYSPEQIKIRGMTVVPYTVFINPKLKVVDYQKVVHVEGCESVRGFEADVARYKEVEVTGYNGEGELISKMFKNWPARIVQHEMDHLDGKLYTDVMERKSFACICWEEVNLSKGKVVLPFTPE